MRNNVLIDSYNIEVRGPSSRPTHDNRKLQKAIAQIDWNKVLRRELGRQGIDLTDLTFGGDPSTQKRKRAARLKPHPVTYNVEITRHGYGHHEFQVRARSPEEASETALTMAGDYEFSEHDAEYEVTIGNGG